MAHPDHFYVTLPSNSSEQFFGRQDPASFYTKLASPLYVDPTLYEVGLAEIVFPRTWVNIPDTTLSMRLDEGLPSELTYTATVRGGRYRSIPHLLKHLGHRINKTVDLHEELNQTMGFEYDRVTGRVTCRVAPGFVMILPHTLGVPLGFGKSMSVEIGGDGPEVHSPALTKHKGSTHVGEYEGNINRLSESLMVYTDIVEPQYVGDHLVPLLRHIAQPNSTTKLSDVAEERFSNVHYLTLQRAHIDTIHVHIADATGRKPAFRSGISIAKLHFRRKR